MTQQIWQPALVEKYNVSGPRYTSYPTALEFQSGFAESQLLAAIEHSDADGLSLYVHLPFCHTLCYYCGCNKVITRHQDKADRYLDVLEQEVGYRRGQFGKYQVRQLHLGGGTPTFLTSAQLRRLMAILKSGFQFAQQLEQGIEIDPREMPLTRMDTLAELGFNRISIGVQDFDPAVQAAVNRTQDEGHIFALVARARELAIESVNIDLIYGLPLQTPDSFLTTLQRALELDPDRMSIFNYAHLPDRFAAQRKIDEAQMPAAEQKLAMLRGAIEALVEAGYQYIGMDHFAKPTDELARLQRAGQLHRNFQGYTTHGECDLLGLGVSSISQIGDCYVQNDKTLRDYYAQVAAQGHAISKGVTLDRDDKIRRDLIKQLICNLQLDTEAFAARWSIDFDSYFADALSALEPMLADGLLRREGTRLLILPPGQLLIRNICMCFDRYMQDKLRTQRFSRVI